MNTCFTFTAIALWLAFLFLFLSFKCDPHPCAPWEGVWFLGSEKRPVNCVATGLTGTETATHSTSSHTKEPHRSLFFPGKLKLLCVKLRRGGVYTAELHPQREGLAARKEHGRLGTFVTFNTALSSEFGAILRSCWWTLGSTDHGQHPGVSAWEKTLLMNISELHAGPHWRSSSSVSNIRTEQSILMDCQHATPQPTSNVCSSLYIRIVSVYSRFWSIWYILHLISPFINATPNECGSLMCVHVIPTVLSSAHGKSHPSDYGWCLICTFLNMDRKEKTEMSLPLNVSLMSMHTTTIWT